MSLTTLMRTCRLSCLWLVCQSALREDGGFAFSTKASQFYPFTDWLTAKVLRGETVRECDWLTQKDGGWIQTQHLLPVRQQHHHAAPGGRPLNGYNGCSLFH